jgi:hypothetical protein
MDNLKRLSPLKFGPEPEETEDRNGFEVVLKYKGESAKGPWLVDLSHCQRFDLQDGKVDKFNSAALPIPEGYGRTTVKDGLVVNRLNRTQAVIWALKGKAPNMPEGPSATDITDNQTAMALTGPDVFRILEKVCPLDLTPTGAEAPYIIQGPVMRVPAQIVVLEGVDDNPSVVLAFSRGYGPEMTEIILEAGEGMGLKPAGEKRFTEWFGPKPEPEEKK